MQHKSVEVVGDDGRAFVTLANEWLPRIYWTHVGGCVIEGFGAVSKMRELDNFVKTRGHDEAFEVDRPQLTLRSIKRCVICWELP